MGLVYTESGVYAIKIELFLANIYNLWHNNRSICTNLKKLIKYQYIKGRMIMTERKIILAIDDNVQQLNEFKTVLGSKYDLRVAKAASEAINLLNRCKADVILLDIEMPNITGFEFLKDIKALPSYLTVPIIIVSGNSGPEFNSKARSSGAFDVLCKPVNHETLINAIESAYNDTQLKMKAEGKASFNL